jgi:hypothetical protein
MDRQTETDRQTDRQRERERERDPERGEEARNSGARVHTIALHCAYCRLCIMHASYIMLQSWTKEHAALAID